MLCVLCLFFFLSSCISQNVLKEETFGSKVADICQLDNLIYHQSLSLTSFLTHSCLSLPPLHPCYLFFLYFLKLSLSGEISEKAEGSRWHCTVCLSSAVSSSLTRKHPVYLKPYHHEPCHNLPDTYLIKVKGTSQEMCQECCDCISVCFPPCGVLRCSETSERRCNFSRDKFSSIVQ